MKFKLKFGSLSMYFEAVNGKADVIDEPLFCPTSSFEIEMTMNEREKGIDRAITWPNHSTELPKGTMPLYPGLGVIYGASGSGKTQLLNYVYRDLTAKQVGVRRIMFNEPDLLVSERSAAIVSEVSLLQEVADFIVSDDDILFIDSIRTFIYSSTGGATGKGGVDMQMYTRLTELSILSQLVGKSINVVFNPISADEMVVKNIKEAVKGSVESLYFIDPIQRALHIESRNYQAKRELITIPFDARKLWHATNKTSKSPIEFEERLKEGIVGPLSALLRKKMHESYKQTGF